MYELDIPIDNTKLKLLEYDFVSRKIKEEIIQWCIDLNMNISCKSLLEYTDFYELNNKEGGFLIREFDGDFIHFNFTILQSLRSLSLIFNTAEDRNLFKLTWG